MSAAADASVVCGLSGKVSHFPNFASLGSFDFVYEADFLRNLSFDFSSVAFKTFIKKGGHLLAGGLRT